MIPWIESHTISIGPITLQTWGTFVAAGFLVATSIAARRAKRMGLQDQHLWNMAFWIFLSAMIGSRLFHVVFYEPAYYLANPLLALDPRQPGFAILGGVIGGALATLWYTKKHALDFIAYADTIAWGLPWGCGIGRIGCFLIHDHPGTLTSFVGGVAYPDGHTRHDLGLYLSALGFGIGFLFLILHCVMRGKRIPPGFWMTLFFAVDGVSRFFLDFLRTIDRRYVGLTPTQWVLIPVVIGAVGFFLHQRSKVSVQQ